MMKTNILDNQIILESERRPMGVCESSSGFLLIRHKMQVSLVDTDKNYSIVFEPFQPPVVCVEHKNVVLCIEQDSYMRAYWVPRNRDWGEGETRLTPTYSDDEGVGEMTAKDRETTSICCLDIGQASDTSTISLDSDRFSFVHGNTINIYRISGHCKADLLYSFRCPQPYKLTGKHDLYENFVGYEYSGQGFYGVRSFAFGKDDKEIGFSLAETPDTWVKVSKGSKESNRRVVNARTGHVSGPQKDAGSIFGPYIDTHHEKYPQDTSLVFLSDIRTSSKAERVTISRDNSIGRVPSDFTRMIVSIRDEGLLIASLSKPRREITEIPFKGLKVSAFDRSSKIAFLATEESMSIIGLPPATEDIPYAFLETIIIGYGGYSEGFEITKHFLFPIKHLVSAPIDGSPNRLIVHIESGIYYNLYRFDVALRATETLSSDALRLVLHPTDSLLERVGDELVKLRSNEYAMILYSKIEEMDVGRFVKEKLALVDEKYWRFFFQRLLLKPSRGGPVYRLSADLSSSVVRNLLENEQDDVGEIFQILAHAISPRVDKEGRSYYKYALDLDSEFLDTVLTTKLPPVTAGNPRFESFLEVLRVLAGKSDEIQRVAIRRFLVEETGVDDGLVWHVFCELIPTLVKVFGPGCVLGVFEERFPEVDPLDALSDLKLDYETFEEVTDAIEESFQRKDGSGYTAFDLLRYKLLYYKTLSGTSADSKGGELMRLVFGEVSFGLSCIGDTVLKYRRSHVMKEVLRSLRGDAEVFDRIYVYLFQFDSDLFRSCRDAVFSSTNPSDLLGCLIGDSADAELFESVNREFTKRITKSRGSRPELREFYKQFLRLSVRNLPAMRFLSMIKHPRTAEVLTAAEHTEVLSLALTRRRSVDVLAEIQHQGEEKD